MFTDPRIKEGVGHICIGVDKFVEVKERREKGKKKHNKKNYKFLTSLLYRILNIYYIPCDCILHMLKNILIK